MSWRLSPHASMDDQQLLRYSRHILLDEIGIEGQARLLAAHALIVGAGGLGSPTALYLAAAGVGRISLAENKAASAARRMRAMNPDVRVEPLAERLAGTRLAQLVGQADVVLDCSDNFGPRHAINRACLQHRKPLVSGAAVRFDGQISVFDLRDANAPCYACLFPEHAEESEMRCAEFGVFAPLVGVVGALQAAEALKLLMGIGHSLNGRLLLYNALDAEWRAIKLKKDGQCAVCATK